MSGFKREERYIVIKLKDLSALRGDIAPALIAFMECWDIPTRTALVIEKGWPEFEPTWAAIEARMTGQAAPSALLECAQGDLSQAMQIIEKQQDLLRRVISSSVLSFEQDGPELLVSLEADICAAIKPEEHAGHICDGCGSNGWTGNCDKCIPY